MQKTCGFLYKLVRIYRNCLGYLENGIMVEDSTILRHHYWSTVGCKMDILATLPTDLLYLVTPATTGRVYVRYDFNATNCT